MINWSRIESLASATSVSELIAKIVLYPKEIGFDNFGIAIQFTRQFCEKDFFFTRDNYRNEWSNFYLHLKNPEIARNDARVQLSLNRMPAGAWRASGETSYTDPLKVLLPQTSHQLKMASAFGIRSGITLPLSLQNQEWGFITLSSHSDFPIQVLEEKLLDAMYFTNFASSVFERIVSKRVHNHTISKREVEVLRWAAIGKTSWEISLILGVSERTINYHLVNCAEKMGVKGRRAACSLAIANGVICL